MKEMEKTIMWIAIIGIGIYALINWKWILNQLGLYEEIRKVDVIEEKESTMEDPSGYGYF